MPAPSAAGSATHSPPSSHHPFAALIESPSYRRLYIGQGISLIGSWLQQAAVLWIVYDWTRSESWLGIMEASGVLPGLLVGLFAGVLADRVAPRRMIVVTLVGQMLLALGLAAMVAGGPIPLWQMAAILAATRVLVTFEIPSRQVLLYELVGRSRLTNAIALNSGLFNASRIIGPALAGVVLYHAGASICFAINGLSYLAAIVAVLGIKTLKSAPPLARPTLSTRSLLEGLAYLRVDPRVRWLYATMILFGVIGMGYSALLPAFARVVVGTGPVGYSLLAAAAGTGACLGAVWVAASGSCARKERLLRTGIVLFGLALGCAGILPGLVRVEAGSVAALITGMLCLAVAGLGGILFYACAQSLIQLAIPDQLRGRVSGLWMIGFSGSVPVGALWAGTAARTIGIEPVLMSAAAACLALALLTRVLPLPGVLSQEGPRPSPASAEPLRAA